MKSIMQTYPGFHQLPRGVKQLLVASEEAYFNEAKPLFSDSQGRVVTTPTPHPAHPPTPSARWQTLDANWSN